MSRVLTVDAVRPRYGDLHCPQCARLMLTHAQAVDGSVMRGLSPNGEAVYTKWCGPCRKHVNWQHTPLDHWELEETAQGITSDEFYRRVQEAYGDPGMWAAESTCLMADDYALGYEHCVGKIAPALEEELMVNAGEPTPGALADAVGCELEPEAVLDQFLIR